MTTPAGYTTQTCPTNPDHGNALAMDRGMWCPHEGHHPPKGAMTQNYWTYAEWERLKEAAPESPTNPVPHPSQARAIKVRKSIVRTAKRRRARKS